MNRLLDDYGDACALAHERAIAAGRLRHVLERIAYQTHDVERAQSLALSALRRIPIPDWPERSSRND